MIEVFKGTIFNEEILGTFDEQEKVFDRVLLKQIVDNSIGESNELDFKEKIIKEDKVAKLILAMANSGSGAVIFGITDKGEPNGLAVEEIKDITQFQEKIASYIPANLIYHFQQITLSENEIYGELSGKNFIVLQVPKQYRYAPYLPKKESESLKLNVVYVRKNASVTAVTNEGLEEIFRLRIIEQYEDMSNIELDEHIEQLKVLYNSISISKGLIQNQQLVDSFRAMTQAFSVRNIHYPEEEFDEFISSMIKKKKRKIEIVLEVSNID